MLQTQCICLKIFNDLYNDQPMNYIINNYQGTLLERIDLLANDIMSNQDYLDVAPTATLEKVTQDLKSMLQLELSFYGAF